MEQPTKLTDHYLDVYQALRPADLWALVQRLESLARALSLGADPPLDARMTAQREAALWLLDTWCDGEAWEQRHLDDQG